MTFDSELLQIGEFSKGAELPDGGSIINGANPFSGYASLNTSCTLTIIKRAV